MKKKVFIFCFTFLAAVFLMAQNIISNAVQKAVNSLAASPSLAVKLDVVISDITLNGTQDMTTEASRELKDKVEEHALKNPMFNVIKSRGNKRPDNPSMGIITGNYSIIGDNVEGYLELIRGNRLLGKEPFLIPRSEFKNINLLPDGPKTQDDAIRQDQAIAAITGTVSQTTHETISPSRIIPNTPVVNNDSQSINIQAWFDSQLGNRLYMHREPLEMTIMTDRDCYFKVYTISANNEPPVLRYPNTTDTDNRLVANMPRTIFERAKYVLYKPYGIETIWIVASLYRFENIEQEYIKPLSADTIRTNLRSGTRGELEMSNNSQSFSSFGNVRYSINVLKPHEEHEFNKPDNMTAFVDSMRNDTFSQGGEFNINSNEKSGYSILNSIRVSYRIPGETPDIIEFAYYKLNDLANGRNVNVQTRGGSNIHTFYIDKPGNITQAIQMIRTGIESKGGIFEGNEQQGNFKANGIVGNYKVSERVNVTITDKPVLVPNSLIEKEVRNYFGGR
jgi:uncharacterized membrane protein